MSIYLLLALLAAAACSASAQTTRTWTNSTNTQYNNTANWNPAGAWANGDTLRFNGTVGGNLNLYYQGGQNTGVLLDFTAAQTGAVSISLSNEATQNCNFRLGVTNNTAAITVASGAGKAEQTMTEDCMTIDEKRDGEKTGAMNSITLQPEYVANLEAL